MGIHKRETSASSQMSRERLEAIVGRPQVRLSTGHDNKQHDAAARLAVYFWTVTALDQEQDPKCAGSETGSRGGLGSKVRKGR